MTTHGSTKKEAVLPKELNKLPMSEIDKSQEEKMEEVVEAILTRKLPLVSSFMRNHWIESVLNQAEDRFGISREDAVQIVEAVRLRIDAALMEKNGGNT